MATTIRGLSSSPTRRRGWVNTSGTTKRTARHYLLVVSRFFSSVMTLVLKLPMTAALLSADVGLMQYYSSHVDMVRRVRTQFILLILIIFASMLQYLNAIIIWPRKDRAVFRSLCLLLGDAVVCILASIMKYLGNTIEHAAHIIAEIGQEGEDFTTGKSYYGRGSLVKVICEFTVLVAVLLDAVVHLGVVVYWLWLLPPWLRYPRQYEPVADTKKSMGAARDVHDAPIEMVNPLRVSPIAEAFLAQEQKALRAESKTNIPRTSSAKGRAARNPTERSHKTIGPQFQPEVRYWAGPWTLPHLIFPPRLAIRPALVSSVLSTVAYALKMSDDVYICDWMCHTIMVSAWCLTLFFAAIIALVRFRFCLDYRIGNLIRVDVILVGAAYALSVLNLSFAIVFLVQGPKTVFRPDSASLPLTGTDSVNTLSWLIYGLMGGLYLFHLCIKTLIGSFS